MPIDPSALPPTPGTCTCLCGANYYFQRSGMIGQQGYFHCRRCGRRYRMYDEAPWEPFRQPTQPPSTR